MTRWPDREPISGRLLKPDPFLQGQLNTNNQIHKYQQYKQLKRSDKVGNSELQDCNVGFGRELLPVWYDQHNWEFGANAVDQAAFSRVSLNPSLVTGAPGQPRPILLGMGGATQLRSSQDELSVSY